jgi:hypothetical protein
MSKNQNRSLNLGGRPPIEIDPVQLEKLAARWMTKDAAADFLGITRSTLHNKLKESTELEKAWHRGRAMLQANTMDWLITSAQKGDVKAQMFLAERVCGLSPKALEQDAASAAEDNALHVRAALKRMTLLENGQLVIDQQPVERQESERETVEID